MKTFDLCAYPQYPPFLGFYTAFRADLAEIINTKKKISRNRKKTFISTPSYIYNAKLPPSGTFHFINSQTTSPLRDRTRRSGCEGILRITIVLLRPKLIDIVFTGRRRGIRHDREQTSDNWIQFDVRRQEERAALWQKGLRLLY